MFNIYIFLIKLYISGTLRHNIVYGIDKYSEDDIDHAIALANAKEFIYNKEMFPETLETVVGERGIKLSGG